MWKKIYFVFDRLEDRIRGRLSRKPIIYAFVGGIGVVLFWRGVWHLVDTIMFFYFGEMPINGMSGIPELPWWDGLASLIAGSLLLLFSGIFISNFIGNEIIISGLRGEKKVVDKTKEEIEQEINSLASIQRELDNISKHLKKVFSHKVPSPKKKTTR